MPRSQPEIDICFIADGIGPRTIGGVSRWAQSLTAALAHRTFALHGSGGELPPARVYHALTPAAAATAGPAVRATGRPLLLTCHAMSSAWHPEGVGWQGPDASAGGNGNGNHGNGNGNGGPVGPPPNGRARIGYEEATLITAVGQAVAASHVAAGASADRMLVVPNGAPTSTVEKVVREPLVGFVGRLAPVKGLERLLRAMRAVRAERPDARLVLVGPSEGPAGYEAHLRRLSEDAGLRRAIHFAGADRPERWYPQLACLALASETEGMPLVLLEAMAHGVPCVAPDVGSVREALGDAGVVVAPGSDDALAEGILAVLDDHARAARLAAAGRARAARWTAADTAAAFELLYVQLGLSCATSCS